MNIDIITKQDLQTLSNNLEAKIDLLFEILKDQKSAKRLISKSQLALSLSCAESTIDNMRRQGLIKTYFIGIGRTGKPLFDLEEVIKDLKSNS